MPTPPKPTPPKPPNNNNTENRRVPLWQKPHKATEVAKLTLHTGGDDRQREEEARRILGMLLGVLPEPEEWDEEGPMKKKDLVFVADLREKAQRIPFGLYVSGKQLFWLRDIKDRMVASGLL